MVIHCIVRKSCEETPVELFQDARAALARFNELKESGEENIQITAVEL